QESCCETHPPPRGQGSSIPNDGDRYRHGRKISTSFAESTVNQVISKRMVTLASHSMYTNHCNSTLDKQERELYVRPSVRSECVGAPSTNRRKKTPAQDRSKRNDFPHIA